MHPHASDAIGAFREFCQSRADLSWFLRPLCGKELICDCSHSELCHGSVLIDLMHACFTPSSCLWPGGPVCQRVESHNPSLSSSCPAVVPTPVDLNPEASDSEDEGILHGQVFNPEEWHSVDETLRGRPQIRSERPGWPKAWNLLIACIRTASVLLFWEIFSGTAGLSKAFAEAGWSCAPPLDIMFDQSYNLMDPAFVCIVMGLVLEKRFRLVHLGPPCSSFSMAVNRFPAHAMRSRDCPDGFANLTAVQSDKVALGNSLAKVAIFIASAQLQVGMHFCLEQPESSLMWMFTPMADFIAARNLFIFTFHACAFGAPWKKPTSILTSMIELSAIQRMCSCRRPHQVLAGKSPDGRNWTAVASPYWPELTHVWAKLCANHQPTTSDVVQSASHVAGFGWGNDDRSIEQILSDMSFNPSGNTSVFTSAVRIAAGMQSSSRSVPTILPEFLGPEAHLACALQLQHPFARPPPISPQIGRALDLHKKHGDHIITYRSQLSDLLRRLAIAVYPANNFLVSKVHRWLQPSLLKRNVRFMVEVNYILDYDDHDLFLDLVFGLPMMGWARHSPVLIQRVSPTPCSLDEHDIDLDSHNISILQSIGPSKSKELDNMAWAKCLEDFSGGGLVGPFESLESVVHVLGFQNLASFGGFLFLNNMGVQLILVHVL